MIELVFFAAVLAHLTEAAWLLFAGLSAFGLMLGARGAGAMQGARRARTQYRGPAIFVVTGQSNPRGPVTTPTGGFADDADVQFWYTSEQHTATALAARGLGIDAYDVTQGRGPELALMEALKATGKRWACLKHVWGGKSLYNAFRPWSPRVGSLRTIAGDSVASLRAMIEAIVAADPTAEPYVAGLLIWQWESDGVTNLSPAWGGGARTWIARWRAETHPDLPAFIARPADWQTFQVDAPARVEIEAAAEAIEAEVPNVYLIETTDLTEDGGHVHATVDALQIFGGRVAALFVTLPPINYLDPRILRCDVYDNEGAAVTAASGAPVYLGPAGDFWAVENVSAGKHLVERAAWENESLLPVPLAQHWFPNNRSVASIGDAFGLPFNAWSTALKSGRVVFRSITDFDPKSAGTRVYCAAGLTVASIFQNAGGGLAQITVFADGVSVTLATADWARGDEMILDRDLTPGHGANNVKLYIRVGGVGLAVLKAQGTLVDGHDWADQQSATNVMEFGGMNIDSQFVWVGTLPRPELGPFVP